MPPNRRKRPPKGDVNKLLPALQSCFTQAENSYVPSRSIGWAIREYDPNISWADCKTPAWGQAIRQAFPNADNEKDVTIENNEYAAWYGIKPTDLAPGNWSQTNEDDELIHFSSLEDEPDGTQPRTGNQAPVHSKTPTWKKWAWGLSIFPFMLFPAMCYIFLSIPGWLKPEWKRSDAQKWAIAYASTITAVVILSVIS